MDDLGWLRKRLTKLYKRNPHVKLLQIRVADISKGTAFLEMAAEYEKHGNLHGVVHGGAVASLADTAMGVACSTLGNKVVTVDMNINFIKNAGLGIIRAVGKVLHSGRHTMVAEAEIFDTGNVLLAKARGTFFVVGQFEQGDEEDDA